MLQTRLSKYLTDIQAQMPTENADFDPSQPLAPIKGGKNGQRGQGGKKGANPK